MSSGGPAAAPGRLRRAHSVADMRTLAQARLPRMVFDFCDGAAEDEITLARNEQAFHEIEFIPQPLVGTQVRDQSIELFGRRLAMPVIIGPTGLAGMLWPEAEIATANAAARAGTAYCMSHGSTSTIEELAARHEGPRWFQVFMYRDRGLTKSFADRARAAGYEALVLTTDNQVLGMRERDLRNGFVIPPKVTLRDALGMVRCVPWLATMARRPSITFANYVTEERKDILSLGAYIGQILDPAAAWKDVAWLRDLWPGPLLLKGVLHPDEARRAAEIGVDGVIVSNHGGRQLDGAVASLDALPGVVAAAGDRLAVLLDGGVRRGAHVVKALALGARACLIGRPHLWGVAVGGEAGVARVLEIFRRDIDRTLALGGWDSLAALGPACLRPHGAPR